MSCEGLFGKGSHYIGISASLQSRFNFWIFPKLELSLKHYRDETKDNVTEPLMIIPKGDLTKYFEKQKGHSDICMRFQCEYFERIAIVLGKLFFHLY